MRRVLAVTATAICVAGIGTVAAYAIRGSHNPSGIYADSAPGVMAPVGALERTPVAVNAPDEVKRSVRRFASRHGGDPDAAERTLRELRAGLGKGHVSMYAFQPDGGATCLHVTTLITGCPAGRGSRDPLPGMIWGISGGYPAWATSDHVAIPPALVGLVADNIRDVTFTENGKPRPLDIVNGAFYEELGAVQPGVKWNELRVKYTSGEVVSTRVPLP